MRAAATAVLLAFALPAAADVYHLLDGDRITGKTLSGSAGTYRVQTAYGRISIPKGKILKIVRDDGREEVLNAAAEPTPPPALPKAPPLRLVLIVTGASFWQAWSPSKDAPPDSALRLEVRLDEEAVAAYTDEDEDPDIPGAVVNAFSFDAEKLAVASAAEGTNVFPPEARPGRISLKIDLPGASAGERRLAVAYQGREAGGWRDLASAAIHVELDEGATNFVDINQDRGRMEFSGFPRKKMKGVESFRIAMRME